MGADWGLYSALRGQDNWAQKRQDKMQSLMMLERREQKSQQDLDKQMQLEQGMQNYFDEIAKIDALAEDQGRIQEKEKEARRSIYKGIAAVNGNLKAYMSTGGLSALSEYKRDILGSDAVKNAALNKVNMSNFIKDKSEGKYVKNVEVEIPVMEEDGVTPKIENGEPVTEKQTVTMEKQAQLFRDGVITKLEYNGAEKKVKLDPLKFSQTVKNPNDPYTAYAVTTDDMYNYAIEQGASEEYAKKVAVEYGKSAVKTKQPWRWAKEDKYDDMLKASKAAKYSGGTSGSSKTTTLNQVGPELNRLAIASKQSGLDSEKELGLYERQYWGKNLGLVKDASQKRQVPDRPLNAIDPITGKKLNVTNALNVSLGDQYIVKPDGRKYIIATAHFDADEPIDGNPYKENWFGGNKLTDKDTRNNWQFINMDETNMEYDKMGFDDGADIVTGQILIDVTAQMNNQNTVDQLNRFVGIKSTFDGHGATGTQAMQDQNMQLDYQATVNQIIKDEKVSREEAIRIANTIYAK